MRKTRSSTYVLLVCASAIALVLSACGKSSAAGGDSQSSASAPSQTPSSSSQSPASSSPSSDVSPGSSTGSGSATGAAGAKVAFIETTEEAGFFQDMKKGVVDAAKKAGLALDIYNANSDSSKQVQAIQTYVGQGYKALIVSPIDENGLAPALQAAHDKGVKTIVIDSDMAGPGVDLSVGTDNAAAAVIAGNWLNDWQKTQTTPLRIGIIGALTSVPQNKRKDSFIKTVEPAGATILQTVNGNNVQATAQAAAQDLFTAQPTMNLLYATGEPALIGALAANRATGSKVKIYGWDLSPAAIQGIDDGSVIGVVQQTPGKEGEIAVASVVTLLTGGTTDKHIDTSVTIVTKANVDQYRDLYGK